MAIFARHPLAERTLKEMAAIASAIAVGIDHKQTEIALQEQTDLLQLILRSMSDGVVVANEQGQFLIFNTAAEQIFGDGATDTEVNEWSQHYGLFLPDQITPFPRG
jgi:PAS domain-containing protein